MGTDEQRGIWDNVKVVYEQDTGGILYCDYGEDHQDDGDG
jgi:hypothetical protein